MAQGSFRSDLYYRLNVVSLEIPSLRERPEDIPHLIRHFIERKTQDLGLPERSLSGSVIDRLISYGWPGNVRELENVIERMLVLSPIDAQVIGPDQLPTDLVDGPGVTVAVREEVLTGSKSLSDAVDEFERDIIGEALNRTHYNQTRAANVLGTTRRILKYRMDKLGIDGDPVL
jgi:transcriptional regulator with PAS, ATPase and Fis domain